MCRSRERLDGEPLVHRQAVEVAGQRRGGASIGDVKYRLFVEIDDHRHELEGLEVRVLIDPQSAAGEAPPHGAFDDPVRFFPRQPSWRATASGVASFTHAIASRSNSSVNSSPGS